MVLPLFEKSKYDADDDRNLHNRTAHAFSQGDPSNAMIILFSLAKRWHNHVAS
jgi:hypothetical protein